MIKYLSFFLLIKSHFFALSVTYVSQLWELLWIQLKSLVIGNIVLDLLNDIKWMNLIASITNAKSVWFYKYQFEYRLSKMTKFF